MKYTNQVDGCQIWDGFSGIGFLAGRDICVEDSPRAGGKYIIGRPELLMISGPEFDDSHRARLTSALVTQRLQGNEWPIVTARLIEETQATPLLPVNERADRLLRYIAKCSSDELGKKVPVLDSSDRAYMGALAWSDSTSWSELLYLSEYLHESGLIECSVFPDGRPRRDAKVTVAGYLRIEAQRLNVNSSQTFVAMWLDPSMNEPFEEGIRPAIEGAGYTALRIDQKEHINKIDDEIIAEIRRSRFLVADFTHGEDGARGGVYYEAGFAHGLGIPVIFTCREDAVDTLHFDTNHYNHIVWSTPEELRERLRNRIRANIDKVPGSRGDS